MKTIKKILFMLISVIISVCVLSCSEEYSSPLKGKTIPDQTYETGEYTKTLEIGKNDLSKCTITSNAHWCIANIDKSSIIVSVLVNETYEERRAIVTLTDPEDGTILSFNVIQNQNDAILVDKSNYTIPEEGGEFTIDVQSNVSYNVEITSVEKWLTQVTTSTRGLVGSTVKLKADKNNSGDERTAYVRLKDSKSGTMSNIVIKQELTPSIEFDKEEITVFEEGGEVELKVNSNIALNTKYSKEWISSIDRKEVEDFSFIEKIKVSSLPSSVSSRSATIDFTDKLGKWKISKSITINQVKSLSIKESSLNLYVGETYSLTLNNNTGQSISWKSSDTSVATVNSSGKITAVGSGSTTITATTADGKYSAKITVTVKVALRITSGNIKIGVGDTYSISYTNNTGKSLSWSSSNTSVATVNSSGKVTGVGGGSATITVKTADGQYSDRITVTVEELDIENYISGSCNAGHSVMVTSSGTYEEYFVSCTLKNKSSHNITVKKCTAYSGSKFVGVEDNIGTLKAGSSVSVKVSGTNSSVTNGSYTFTWEYTYDGKSYTYNVRYN